MSERITIRYTTSDNRTIVLSESDSSPDRAIKLSRLEKIKLAMEAATFLAIMATLGVYVVLAILQFKANKIYHEQASVAQDTEQRQLRAYLHVDATTGAISLTGTSTKPTQMDFAIVNDGQTPAHDVIIRRAIILAAHPANFRLDIPTNDEKLPGYIPARGTQYSQATLEGKFSDEQIAQLTNDTIRIYLVGEIEYSDVFNITRHFRFGISIPGDEIKSMVDKGQFPTGEIKTKITYEPGYNYEY
jgi:hypothetical protein